MCRFRMYNEYLVISVKIVEDRKEKKYNNILLCRILYECEVGCYWIICINVYVYE